MKPKIPYIEVKAKLLNVAELSKKRRPKDKPWVRMDINNALDYYLKEYDLTEYQQRLLENYACKLQPE